uniref:Ovule protein n=1 Tax=Ascaris lumbricoides TaxID=6252 RepID=A0A9J2PRU8_ASCLU
MFIFSSSIGSVLYSLQFLKYFNLISLTELLQFGFYCQNAPDIKKFQFGFWKSTKLISVRDKRGKTGNCGESRTNDIGSYS